MKHTQGTWETLELRHGKIPLLSRDKLIAYVMDADIKEKAETIANAKLLRAAPELLQALQRINTIAEEFGSSAIEITRAMSEIRGECRVAIQKATS